MLIYLTPTDYYVSQNGELCNGVRGNSFVMFSSASCHYCTELYPAFVKLSHTIQGCSFCVMNIDQENKRVVGMSRSTSTPIEYVPYVILYANGVPVSQFVPDEDYPDRNYDNMRQFLIEETSRRSSVANNRAPQQQPRQQQQQQQQRGGGGGDAGGGSQIPAYSIGIPGNLKKARGVGPASKNKKNVCYLDYNSAYSK